MYYRDACLSLHFEALHKLMFNGTVCLEVFAALSSWLNMNTSWGCFISLTSFAALIWHVFSGCVSFQYFSCVCLLGLQKKLRPPLAPKTTEASNGSIV